MIYVYNLLLFLLTFGGGWAATRIKRIENWPMNNLLAFSGSFLLSITFLHLLPESFSYSNKLSGIYLLLGFFLQLIIQKFTHGMEHGHVHLPQAHHHHHVPIGSILIGMSLHSFMEGIPLGLAFHQWAAQPSLYVAIAAHKLPEAILIGSLLFATQQKTKAILMLIAFSLITPISSSIVHIWGQHYIQTTFLMATLLPVVAGSFIHIATTIFFESGTKQHALNKHKIGAMLAGLALGLITLIIE